MKTFVRFKLAIWAKPNLENGLARLNLKVPYFFHSKVIFWFWVRGFSWKVFWSTRLAQFHSKNECSKSIFFVFWNLTYAARILLQKLSIILGNKVPKYSKKCQYKFLPTYLKCLVKMIFRNNIFFMVIIDNFKYPALCHFTRCKTLLSGKFISLIKYSYFHTRESTP